MPEATNPEGTFTQTQVAAALNGAADDILIRLGPDAAWARDFVNLLVVVSLHYLDNPNAADLDDAIRDNCENNVQAVLGRIANCI